MRWIVNFDQDLLDGLVLAAQIAAYCPYLVRRFFKYCVSFIQFNDVRGFVQAWFSFAMLRSALTAGSSGCSCGELQVELWLVRAEERDLALTLCTTKVLGSWGTARGPERHSCSRGSSRKSPDFHTLRLRVCKRPGFPLRGVPSSEASAPGVPLLLHQV